MVVQKEKAGIGKTLVSALERISTLRNLNLDENQNKDVSPKTKSVSSEMAQLFPSLKSKADSTDIETGNLVCHALI